MFCEPDSHEACTCLVQDMTEAAEAPIEPETPPMAAPGPPEPTPEAIAEEEAEESDGADWDAMDLDEITLPGQKSAKELAAEKVQCRVPAMQGQIAYLWFRYVPTGCSWAWNKHAVFAACTTQSRMSYKASACRNRRRRRLQRAAAAAAEAAAKAEAESNAAKAAEEEAARQKEAAAVEAEDEDDDEDEEEGSESESGSAAASGSDSESESESDSEYRCVSAVRGQSRRPADTAQSLSWLDQDWYG